MRYFISKITGIFIRNLFLLLGPIYIKIGQLLAYNYPILKELYTLQDDCGPIPKKYLKYIQNKYPDLEINSNCVSSGSIACTHLCKYKNIECIVKIKRPNIQKHMESNIYYMNYIINGLDFFVKNVKIINFKLRLKKLINLYMIQCDFKNEIDNWKKYKHIFGNLNSVVVPNIYEEISNDDIIVMEYLPGYNMRKHKNVVTDDIFKKFKGLYFTSMINNIHHGDLHPGNFSINKNGQIVIYDFGVCFDFNTPEHSNSNYLMDLCDSILCPDKYEAAKCIVMNYTDLDYDSKVNLINEICKSDILDEMFAHLTIPGNSSIENSLDVLKILVSEFEKRNIQLNECMIESELVLVAISSSFSLFNEILGYGLKI